MNNETEKPLPVGSDDLVLPLRVIDLDSPFLFGVVRDMTADERAEAERHGRHDNPPMSVLGVTSEGLAAVEGEKLAEMFAAAPRMLDALRMIEWALAQPDADPALILARNSPIRLQIRDAIPESLGQNAGAVAPGGAGVSEERTNGKGAKDD